MKKLLFLLLTMVFVLGGCFETANKIKVRIKNETKHNYVNVCIGKIEYGNIASKTTTEYIEVPAGTHKITSDMGLDGSRLNGSCTVSSGTGTVTYTLTIDPDENFISTKD